MASYQPVQNATRFPSITTCPGSAAQRIMVNGEEIPPVAYMSYFGTSHLYKQAAANSVRQVAGRSGVHIYLGTDDVFYAGRGWIGIHAVEAGAKKVRLPFCAHVTDAKTGERIANGTNQVDVVMSKHDTVLYRVEPI